MANSSSPPIDQMDQRILEVKSLLPMHQSDSADHQLVAARRNTSVSHSVDTVRV
jgi:hypothetical protein